MQFVSEPITPEPGSFGTEMMTRGLAALPGAFTWRNRRYEIVECIDHCKQSAPEATGEVYLRRQQFTVVLDSGQKAVLYVLRNAAPGSSRAGSKRRWFMYSIEPDPTEGAGHTQGPLEGGRPAIAPTDGGS